MTQLEALARQSICGDKDAFIALMEACKPSLLRAARAILKNEEDVADAMQNTVLRAFENIFKLKKPRYCKTWLTRILINNCYDCLKQRKTVSLEEFPPDSGVWDEAPQPDWDSPLDVRSALGRLSSEDRLLLTLFYIEDMSQRQIGKVLGVSENAVKQRLARAKRHFKTSYEKGAVVHE